MTSALSAPTHIASHLVGNQRADRRRWLILGVLCASILVVVLDGTIVNVALPTLATELGASNSQLQWIVDAYILVFAGLLMVAGSFGDRIGRKWVLMGGLTLFATFSALGASAGSPCALIGWRAAMGLGGALMFPATLAILVNVFTVANERAIAIAAWAATAGLGVALGPVTGGWLLEHFWWGSVFIINVPVVAVALVLIAVFVPNSRDTTIERFDPLGTVLSVAAIGTMVWAVIEGPEHGWVSPASILAFALATVLLVGFVAWERRNARPMLDVTIFTNMRFTAGSVSMTFAFFTLMGFVFLITQYFQFVRGYGTLGAGIRTVPFALFMALTSPTSAKLAQRVGTKRVVVAGLTSMAVGFSISARTDVTTPYWVIVVVMFFVGGGLGTIQAPATEAIMGSLPPAKAGVGSAVNDTARELGSTLGVAIVGSVFSSIYASKLDDAMAGAPVPHQAIDLAKDSVGGAEVVAHHAGVRTGPQTEELIHTAINDSFISGWHAGLWICFGVALLGALFAWRWLPAHDEDKHADVAAVDDPDVLAA
jgi:EmrB/QacA subfamily drug resistance transporter